MDFKTKHTHTHTLQYNILVHTQYNTSMCISIFCSSSRQLYLWRIMEPNWPMAVIPAPKNVTVIRFVGLGGTPFRPCFYMTEALAIHLLADTIKGDLGARGHSSSVSCSHDDDDDDALTTASANWPDMLLWFTMALSNGQWWRKNYLSTVLKVLVKVSISQCICLKMYALTILYIFLKIADVQAHNALYHNTLWACRSVISAPYTLYNVYLYIDIYY